MHVSFTCTVAIFTRNSTATLRRTLQLLTEQTLQPVQVLVVDNNSTDGSAELAQAAGVDLVRIPEDSFNHGLTRDAAATVARGSVVVFLVGDAVPVGRDWLQRLAQPFECPSVAMTQGRENRRTKQYFWERRWSGLLWLTRDHRRWKHQYGFGASNVCAAYRATVLRDHPIGPVLICEDKHYQRELTMMGWKAVLVRNALVDHSHSYGWSELYQRVTLVGYGMNKAGAHYGLRDWAIDTAIGLLATVLFAPVLLYRHLGSWVVGRRLEWTEWLFAVAQPTLVFRGHHLDSLPASLLHQAYRSSRQPRRSGKRARTAQKRRPGPLNASCHRLS